MSVVPDKSLFSQSGKNQSLVGKDLLAVCGKCKLDLKHTVVSLNDAGKPGRVMCNTCKTEREYKAPKAKASKAKALKKGMDSDSGLNEDGEEATFDDSVVSKVLGADAKPAKKKAKAKAKKKDSSDSSSSKGGSLPLSMLTGSGEDLAQYETKLVAAKSRMGSARTYKATETFAPGDIINHKTFGTGFVLVKSGLNKMEVLFRDGRKLLVNADK